VERYRQGKKFLIRPPELSENPTSTLILVNQEELGEINDEFSV
jgi:hypothetical protein